MKVLNTIRSWSSLIKIKYGVINNAFKRFLLAFQNHDLNDDPKLGMKYTNSNII